MESTKRALYGIMPATIDLDKNIGKAYAKLSELKNDKCDVDEFGNKVAEVASLLYKVSEILSKFDKDTFKVC